VVRFSSYIQTEEVKEEAEAQGKDPFALTGASAFEAQMAQFMKHMSGQMARLDTRIEDLGSSVTTASSMQLAQMETMMDNMKAVVVSAEQHKVPYNAIVLPDHEDLGVCESLHKDGLKGLSSWFDGEVDDSALKMRRSKDTPNAVEKAKAYVDKHLFHDSYRLHLLCGCGPCDDHPTGMHFVKGYPGMPMKQPKRFIAKAAPILKATSQVLSACGSACPFFPAGIFKSAAAFVDDIKACSGAARTAEVAHVAGMDDAQYEQAHMTAGMLEVQNFLEKHDKERTYAQWLFPGYKGNRLVWVCEECRERMVLTGELIVS